MQKTAACHEESSEERMTVSVTISEVRSDRGIQMVREYRIINKGSTKRDSSQERTVRERYSHRQKEEEYESESRSQHFRLSVGLHGELLEHHQQQ